MAPGAQLFQVEVALDRVEHAVVDRALAMEANELDAPGGDCRQHHREMLSLGIGEFVYCFAVALRRFRAITILLDQTRMAMGITAIAGGVPFDFGELCGGDAGAGLRFG